jgi:hypothetical protein
VVKNIKLLFTLSFTLLSFQLFAQHISGIVVDKNTLLPIAHATVSIPSQTVLTSAAGQFTLIGMHNGDPLKVSCVGYRSYNASFYALVSDTIRIYLEQSIIALKDVAIKAKRNANTDSIRLRKEFVSVFNYKGTSIKDAFITRDPYVYKWDDFITSTNNATTILSVNLLSVVDLLNKNNAPVSKLQKTLIREEQYNYVSQVFSKQKVTEITHLKGDSLQTFMDKYRPSAADTRSMSDYDVMMYIKKCYAEFVKPGGPKK